MYDVQSHFLGKPVLAFAFPIREIQTDNGSEFTNALKAKHCDKSLFEQALENMNIIYHRIRVAMPRHNGKAEKQHRTDKKRFYKKMKMYNLADGRKQLAKYNTKSNNIPKICLDFKTPNYVATSFRHLYSFGKLSPIIDNCTK